MHRFRMRVPIGTKILLLNYSAGEANWGCKATSKGLIELIRKAYPHARILKRPTWSVNNEDQARYKEVLPNNPKEFDSYILPRISTDPSFKDFDWAEVIILNGEGNIHEYQSWRAEPYLRLLEVYAAKRFFPRKKTMTVNQTVDYWSDDFGYWVKEAYENCDYVSVREPRSLARLKSLGLEKTKLVPDAAFITRPVSEKKARAFLAKRGIEEGYIGLFFGQTMGYADFDKIEDFFIRLRKFNRQVVLFAAPWPDHDVAENLKMKYNVNVIGLEAYPEMLVGILREASMVLSGRFHCCIFTALAGTPLVPWSSNTDKIESTIELLEYDVPVMAFENTSNAQIMDTVEDVWKNRDQLKKDLQNHVPQVVRATLSGYTNVLEN